MLLQLDKTKIKTIRLLFPLHKEGLSSYLSPILGQYAIKNTEFINEFIVNFHKVTNNSFQNLLHADVVDSGGALYDEILFIPLILNVYKGGKFTLQINKPSVGFIFSSSFKKRRRIYKRLLNQEVSPLRNYKKLFQMAFFKTDNELNDFSAQLVKTVHIYKQIRNALYQKT